jgi:hypothetical protein
MGVVDTSNILETVLFSAPPRGRREKVVGNVLEERNASADDDDPSRAIAKVVITMSESNLMFTFLNLTKTIERLLLNN